MKGICSGKWELVEIASSIWFCDVCLVTLILRKMISKARLDLGICLLDLNQITWETKVNGAWFWLQSQKDDEIPLREAPLKNRSVELHVGVMPLHN